MTTSSQRQASEKDFYDNVYRNGWLHENEPLNEAFVPANMRIYWSTVRGLLARSGGSPGGVRVLDCGCGIGVLSVLLAKAGARVTAVDISPNSIRILERVARANGLENRIAARVMGLEDLTFADEEFNLVVGTRVLHHVDLRRAGPHLARVLKRGGRAAFWECTERNPVLRFARKYVRRVLPLPKFGTPDEHPLRHDEIEFLETCFAAPVEVVPAPFHFFSLADQYICRQRLRPLSAILTGLDAFVAKHLPALNHFSFHQILVLLRSVPAARA